MMPYPFSYNLHFRQGAPTSTFAQALSQAFDVPVSRVGVFDDINDRIGQLMKSGNYDVFVERLPSPGGYETVEIFVPLRDLKRWTKLALLQELCRLMRVEGALEDQEAETEFFHVVSPDGSVEWVEIDLQEFLDTGALIIRRSGTEE